MEMDVVEQLVYNNLILCSETKTKAAAKHGQENVEETRSTWVGYS